MFFVRWHKQSEIKETILRLASHVCFTFMLGKVFVVWADPTRLHAHLVRATVPLPVGDHRRLIEPLLHEQNSTHCFPALQCYEVIMRWFNLLRLLALIAFRGPTSVAETCK